MNGCRRDMKQKQSLSMEKSLSPSLSPACKIMAFCLQVRNSSFASSTAYCDDYRDNEPGSEGKLRGPKPIKKEKKVYRLLRSSKGSDVIWKAKKEMKNCLINYAHQ